MADDTEETDEQYEELETAVLRQSLHREILYKTLGYCYDEHTLSEIEDEIASYPEFETALQSQYFMVQVLVKHGGLEMTRYDSSGKVVSDEDLVGLDEDEADDLVDSLAFTTTDVGRRYYEDNLYKDRIAALFEDEPLREDTYRELLAYCLDTPHAYDDIKALLTGRDIMRVYDEDGRYLDLQASVFVDKLERAGAMYWTRALGWQTSDAGKEFAQS